MYENIFSLELPVGERLKLVRNRLVPEEYKELSKDELKKRLTNW